MHFNGPTVNLIDKQSKIILGKFKRCKKCKQAKIGLEFICRNEFHWHDVDEYHLNHYYEGWY